MKNRSLLNGVGVALVLSCALAEAATPWDAETHHLAFGDFNGDNRTDLLYIAKSPSLHSGIALSDGALPSIDLQSWPSNYRGVAWHSSVHLPIVADFNGDGTDDVLMHRQSAGEHYLFFTNSLGQISTIGQTIDNSLGGVSGGWGGDTHRIVVGNFDGIGGADVTNIQALVGYAFPLYERPEQSATRKPMFEEERTTLVLQGVNFEYDSARLTQESHEVLDRVARSLREWPEVRVEIGGYTDDVGTDEYNMELSERRAQAVRDYLMAKGVGGSRLEAKGYGKTRPLNTNNTEEARAQNRRVELKRR